MPKRNDSPRCSVHPKSLSVARYRDTLTGTVLDACKRCRDKYSKFVGWEKVTVEQSDEHAEMMRRVDERLAARDPVQRAKRIAEQYNRDNPPF